MMISAFLLLLNTICTQGSPQARYQCKEDLVNCAVLYGGTIMTEEQILSKCVDRKSE